MVHTYIKKNGEISTYNTKKYNADAYAKNKEKILSDKIHCDFCNISYLKCNHSNHLNSKKHTTVIAYINKINVSNPQPPDLEATRSASNDSNETLDKCELESK